MFAQDSIDLLKTSGIDFEAFQNYGVDVHYFGELMMMSGLALSDDVKWLTFHCSYDFLRTHQMQSENNSKQNLHQIVIQQYNDKQEHFLS